jgi:hypothetical protein
MFEGARKQRIKITFVMLPVCILIVIICYVYGAWARAEKEKQLVPRLGVDSMVKGLRQYQRQTGQFPGDFSELDKRIWKYRTAPDFGSTKRTLSFANYYYVYAKSDPLTCTIWAIPSGPKREEGSTHFLVVTPDVIRNWKGPALGKADIDRISSEPTGDLLNMLGMTEQKVIDQRSPIKAKSGLF